MKKGEVVFNEEGVVVEVNGYTGGRKSFEYIELSEYYGKVIELEETIKNLEFWIGAAKQVLKDLT